jgi:hypothetical protein
MDDLTLLRTFYEEYGSYFGDDSPVVLHERTLGPSDRATIAGLRAAIAMETRRAETAQTGSVAKP